MTGNTKAPWMGNALAVKDHDIWSHLELRKDLQQGWGFAEGQQPGDVGEVRCGHNPLTLHHGKRRVVQNDYASIDSRCGRDDGDICTGNVANLMHIRAHLDRAPQPLLDALGFSDADVPGMKLAILP